MTPTKRSEKEPTVTNPPKLPKWIRDIALMGGIPGWKQTEDLSDALEIAWAALDYYGSFEKDEKYIGEARKAMKKIRRIGR